MQSRAATVAQYLAELPADRRAALQAVRDAILENLDDDFEEGMQYGMIGYFVPHRVFPAGYHCDPRQPLPFAGLASQKNYMSLYMMHCYENSEAVRWLSSRFAAAGKKLDMGKCCIRFRKLEDLPLGVIGEAIGRVTTADWVTQYETNLRRGRGPARKAAPTAKKAQKKAAKRVATAAKVTPATSRAKTAKRAKTTQRARGRAR